PRQLSALCAYCHSPSCAPAGTALRPAAAAAMASQPRYDTFTGSPPPPPEELAAGSLRRGCNRSAIRPIKPFAGPPHLVSTGWSGSASAARVATGQPRQAAATSARIDDRTDMRLPRTVERLFRRPATVDRVVGAVDVLRLVAAQEHRERGDFLGLDELPGGLLGEQHLADDLLAGHAARGHGVGDLVFDQRGPDVAGADAVGGDAVFGQFEREHLGQPGDAVLGGDVGGLER